MHRANLLKAAVVFVAITFAFVAAVPSAQAVGTYNRKLLNVGFQDCIGAVPRTEPVHVSQATCFGTDLGGRWLVRVKSDSYNGTGHEHWQIESANYPGTCLVAGNYHAAVLTLGSCQYSGSVHNKFEVFKSVIDGNNNVYQLKDSEAFENNGQHRCILQYYWTNWPEMGNCNVSTRSFNSYWDAVGW